MKKFFCLLLSWIAVLTLHCRFEVFDGGFPEYALLNGLNKFFNSFSSTDFTDLFVLAAVYIMLRFVAQKDKKIDRSSLALSLIFSVALVTAISFKKFNSTILLLGNSYQILISCFCIVGFWIILYGVLRCINYLFEKAVPKQEVTGSFLEKHFLLVGFGIIFLGWLPWIILNYPGSGCPDSVLQLKEFLGQERWGAGHPPLSTIIMGSLLTLGSWLINPNFGYFLYCLLQTCVGAWIFSLSMKKTSKFGASYKMVHGWNCIFCVYTSLGNLCTMDGKRFSLCRNCGFAVNLHDGDFDKKAMQQKRHHLLTWFQSGSSFSA